MIKIIHSADWHLSSSLSAATPAVRRAVHGAQERFIAIFSSLITRENVNVLLLAGDIFDSPEPEERWLRLLRNFCADIPQTQIFITPGNHDPYFSEGIWTDKHWPANVHIFGPEFESVDYLQDEIKLRVSGRAFTRFLCESSLIEGRKPESEQADYEILLLHGDLLTGSQGSYYNPIDLNDSRYADYNYLALGHIHLAQQANANANAGKPIAVYPGPPQGRGFDESGEPGFMFCSLNRMGSDSVQVTWEQRPTDGAMLFIKMDIDISDCKSSLELANYCWQKMREAWPLSQENLNTACWRISLVGTRKHEVQIATDYLGTQLGHKGAFYLRIYDQSQPELAIERLKEQAGFTGLIYKNYERALAKMKKSEPAQRKLMEKALYYALYAHEDRLDASRIEQSMDSYQEYQAEVREL